MDARCHEVDGSMAAGVVHELKTSITIIKGFTELIDERWEDADRNELRAMVGVVGRNSARLEYLVEELLTTARRDADRVAVRGEETDVLTVLRSAADVAVARRVAVEIQCSPELRLTTDAGRLEQILATLVDNSCRYGHPPVVLSAAACDAGISVTISDGGAGVCPGDVETIFELFPPASSTANGSHGMGLHGARRSARMLGGDLAYVAGKRGGSFEVTLPAHAGQPIEPA